MSDGGDLGGPPKEIAIERGGGKPALITCPECGAENIQGTDYCVNCGSDLRTLDIPADTPIPGEGPPGESVGRIAHPNPLTVEPSILVRDAIGRMRDSGHGCAVVVEGGRVIGVFTERDVLNKVSPDRERMLAATVRDAMTPEPVMLRDQESILVALNEMGVGGFRHLPIVDEGGTLRAILSGRDVLAFVAARARLGA
jgi:CBS domain-containing protein